MAPKKSKGFNAPFENLKTVKKLPEAAPPPPPPPPKVALPLANDDEMFLRAVSGAQRLTKKSHKGRVAPPKAEVKRPTSDDELALAELQNLVAGQGEFRVSESEEMHTGLAPGVSFQLLEQLQKGQFAFHRHVDLHGMSRDVAHAEINRFVTQARRDGERCVLIITGRGKSSPNGFAVLRDALPRWLSRSPLRPHVLAFCTARSVDGGPGAFYVLLRRAGVKPFGGAHD